MNEIVAPVGEVAEVSGKSFGVEEMVRLLRVLHEFLNGASPAVRLRAKVAQTFARARSEHEPWDWRGQLGGRHLVDPNVSLRSPGAYRLRRNQQTSGNTQHNNRNPLQDRSLSAGVAQRIIMAAAIPTALLL